MAERHPTELGYAILRLMSEKEMRSSDLARAAGVSGSTLTRVIYGAHRPSLQVLHRLAAALGVSVEEFAGPALDTTTSVPSPVLIELDGMLNPASPLTDEERGELEALLDGLADTYREAMRRSV